jgi:hypothetical protein
MPYLDGRVALVPVLAARPRAAAGGDLHLAILDTDFFRPGNPHYGDCNGAGLDSAASLVRGYPLPAVSSGLIFEHLVGKGTFDIENCDPWTKVQQVHSETVLLAPTRIDAGLLDDQGLCVLAALCCPNLNNDAVHNPYSLAHCCGFSNGILLDFELPRSESAC